MFGIYNRINDIAGHRLNRTMTEVREFSLKLQDFRQFRRRVALASQLAGKKRHLLIPQDKGFLKFGPEAFGGTQGIVEVGRRVFERRGHEFLQRSDLKKGKNYLINILDYEELDEFPPIWDFLFNAQLLSTLSNYYGFLPELCSIALMLSPTNDTTKGSQEAHFDLRDSKHIKVFVPVFDIGEDNGPFEFLPRDLSTELRKTLGVTKRIDDDALFSHVPRSQFIRLTATAGEGLIVDTTNCLHFGGRVRQGYRLMWFIHFGTFWQNNRVEARNPRKDLRLEHIANRARFARNEAASVVLSVPRQ
jgi:hypothetical protein